MGVAISTQCPKCSTAFQLPVNSDALHQMFFTDLVNATGNFSGLTWMGYPI